MHAREPPPADGLINLHRWSRRRSGRQRRPFLAQTSPDAGPWEYSTIWRRLGHCRNRRKDANLLICPGNRLGPSFPTMDVAKRPAYRRIVAQQHRPDCAPRPNGRRAGSRCICPVIEVCGLSTIDAVMSHSANFVAARTVRLRLAGSRSLEGQPVRWRGSSGPLTALAIILLRSRLDRSIVARHRPANCLERQFERLRTATNSQW